MSHTIEDLRALQAESLDRKVRITQTRIMEWYYKYNGKVYVSFSGGKDSTVLLHIARQIFPDIEAIFVDTGLEYPEIKDFVKTIDNVTTLRPKMQFADVVSKYGYPIISKKQARFIRDLQNKSENNEATVNLRLTGINKSGVYCSTQTLSQKWKYLIDAPFKISEQCCDVMKKAPIKLYAKKCGKYPIIGTMATESTMREKDWLNVGCNSFDGNNPISKPLSFWSEQDILKYLLLTGIDYAKVYGDIVPKSEFCGQTSMIGVDTELMTSGVNRTGCMFCGFGCHMEQEPTRFQQMKESHPKQYEYCIGGGEYNDDGLWIPNKKGLGMGKVLDLINVKY